MSEKSEMKNHIVLGCDNHAGKALLGPRHTGCHDTMLVCTQEAFVQQR